MCYNLTLKTAPVLEPLSLLEVKDYLRLPFGADVNGVTALASISPKEQGVGTVTGGKVEVLNHEAAVIFDAGDCVAKVTVTIQESDDDTTYADVYAFAAVDSSNDNLIYSYEYHGLKRYLRAVAVVEESIDPSDVATFSVTMLNQDVDQDDNAYLIGLIKAARQFCENYQNRAFITQTWELSFDYWPCHIFTIPKGNLQKVDSIKYTNSSGVETTLPDTEYVLSTRGILGRVTTPYGKVFPPFVPFPLDAVVVEFTAGYGNLPTDVPEGTKQAMKLLISHWYENRVIMVSDKIRLNEEIKFAVTALLWQERIALL